MVPYGQQQFAPDLVRGSLASASVPGSVGLEAVDSVPLTNSPARGGAGRWLRGRPEGVWVRGGSRAAPPRGRSPGRSILARAPPPEATAVGEGLSAVMAPRDAGPGPSAQNPAQ